VIQIETLLRYISKLKIQFRFNMLLVSTFEEFI